MPYFSGPWLADTPALVSANVLACPPSCHVQPTLYLTLLPFPPTLAPALVLAYA